MALKPSIEPIIWSDLQRLEEYRQAPKSSGLYLIGSQHDAVSPITQTVDMPRSRCMDKEQSKTRHIAASRTAAGEKRSMRTAVKREQRRLAIKKPGHCGDAGQQSNQSFARFIVGICLSDRIGALA